MKQAYQFPAISHFCDAMREEHGRIDTQHVLNSISIFSATKLEHMLMKLHREQPDNFLAMAEGEGYMPAEVQECHPDMMQVEQFWDAILSGEYHAFA